MIEIFSLASGRMLDLAPDTTFEIEYDNPLFEDSHIPVPFSTAITFLPTDHNKQEFGLLDAMLLEPANKKIPAELYASGVKLMTGMLTYDGMDNGCINYTFVGKNMEDDWSEKIWEKEIYQIPPIVNPNDHQRCVKNIMAGLVDGICAPVLINSISAADSVQPLDDALDDYVIPAVKYHNNPYFQEYSEITYFTPAISVMKILADEFQNVDLDPEINVQGQLKYLSILGQYKTDCEYTDTSIPADGMDLARTLPDITALELARILSKIFCAAYFRDGDRFRLRSAEQVLTSAPELNWDAKVADKADLSSDAGSKYSFGFDNGPDENVYNAGETSAAETDVATYDSLATALHAMQDSAYSAWKFSSTNDIYSSRKVRPLENTEIEWPEGWDGPEHGHVTGFLSDLLLHDLNTYDLEPYDNGSGSFDNSVPAKLVRCIPDTIFEKAPVSAGAGEPARIKTVAGHFVLAAIINAPQIKEDRGSEVYIGTVDSNSEEKLQQIVDKGVSVPGSLVEPVSHLITNLNPSALYDTYHRTFAEWIRSRRQLVTADLNLSMADIANFRMWQKVAFRGRCWLVRRLTIDFFAGSDRIEATGEFISV